MITTLIVYRIPFAHFQPIADCLEFIGQVHYQYRHLILTARYLPLDLELKHLCQTMMVTFQMQQLF